MESCKIEYLITVEQKEPFCNTVPAFNNLLRTIDNITVGNNSIEYDTLKLYYEVQIGEIAVDKQRYFHIKLTCGDEKKVEEFEDFLRIVRIILSKASGKAVQILWDDVGFYHAQKAYPLIFEIENIMRKLITKFMLTTIGLAWTSESIPQEVADSIRTKSNKNSFNYLYEADFIQLSNFLFREYTSINTKVLADKIRTAKEIGDLDFEELKLIIPKSNWERYFSSLVSYDSDYLRIRWEKLYERRNQVAHNKSMSRTEFDETIKLIEEIKPKLHEAIGKLDQITISQEDREAVAENAAENNNALFGEFLYMWKLLSSNIYDLALLCIADDESRKKVIRSRYNTRMLVDMISHKPHLLPREFRRDIIELNQYRNIIVHEPDVSFTEEVIRNRIELAQQLRRQVIIATEESSN